VRRFLDEGLDLDTQSAQGSTPLIMAALRGHLRVVRLLLEAGASVELATAGGKTALWVAGHQDRGEVAQLLVLHGASPYACADGVKAGEFPAVMEAFNRVNQARLKAA